MTPGPIGLLFPAFGDCNFESGPGFGGPSASPGSRTGPSGWSLRLSAPWPSRARSYL